ncbi:hypothetical protein OAB57_03635 [Bacteriovoracaceae bacterium]|nr:hypothetical protein [Bacteriovoracaceae bacterium]
MKRPKEKKLNDSHKKVLYQKIFNRWFLFTSSSEEHDEVLYSQIPKNVEPLNDPIEIIELSSEENSKNKSNNTKSKSKIDRQSNAA